MSAATVRAAITAYFQPPAVPGLVQMYKAVPYYVAGDRWDLGANLGSAGIGAVHLDQQSETRITMGAPIAPTTVAGGSKRVDWHVGLVVFYQWLIAEGTQDDDYVIEHDAILEGIADLIRADQTLGCGSNGPIFQAGESRDDIRISRDLPRRSSGKLLIWSVVEFDVVEILQA